MLLRRLFATLLLTLAVLGMMGPCRPAWAHSPFEPGAEVASEIAPEPTRSDGRNDGNALPGWTLTAAPDMPGVPWSALAIVAAAVALGWWRPRRAAAFALVLLLAVFAFEDGLHSVHHGMNQTQASSCPVAAAATHLNATPVDGVAPRDVVLPVVALAVETSPSDPIAYLARPEQGRAPPYSLV
jgi:hypothetical protein